MATDQLTDAKIFKYQFDVPINRPAEVVWSHICEDIDAWWMEDFRVLGSGSEVTLDAKAGGALIETGKEGSILEWYRVQMCVPGQSLYLVGYFAPDWGGPTVSMLKLALKPDGDTCTLTVSDALMGNVTEKAVASAEDGWQNLFSNGLKAHAEA